MTYGASPEAWALWQRLAPPEDLLPVVSNPNAKIGERSKLKDLGKTPSTYNAQREAVGILKWTQKQATERELARWSRDADLGICLQTRSLRAIDVDIADPEKAQAVLDLVELGLGVLPRRGRSNSGKALLLLRMPGEFSKRIVRCGEDVGIIEFLATGQQCIVEGTHPSGARYEWSGLDELSAIPEVSPEEFEVLWAELSKLGPATEERRGMVPAVPRTADDMRDPVVAFLAENGHVKGYERDGRVDVRCPWEGEHTADSGPTATSWFPAGVGGFQQGHFRCLHAHCAHRTDGDFLEAVGYVKADFDVVEAEESSPGVAREPLPAFARDRQGRIEASLNNVLMALRRPDICRMRIGMDEFRGELMYAPGTDGGAWRPLDDEVYTQLRSVLTMGAAGFREIGKELMRDAVYKVAKEQVFDSAIAWANSLEPWDGVLRVETFYTDFFGVPDSPYTRAVARYTWSGLAARCLDPGHKCDMVPVFIGLQGAGKTTAVEAFSPIDDTFVEINLERKDDDLARSLRGKLVGEIAELRGLQGRDAESIKAWISRRFEDWTPKFREFNTRFPRRLMLFGTGNEQGFLDDAQERRWLPMVVGEVDVAGLKVARDQLWAEGVHLFRRLGRVDWEQAYTLAPSVHSDFKVDDPWLDVVAAWLDTDAMDGAEGAKRGDGFVRSHDVMVSALGFRADREDRKAELRVGKVLRRLGFTKGTVMVNGRKAKAWRRVSGFEDLA